MADLSGFRDFCHPQGITVKDTIHEQQGIKKSNHDTRPASLLHLVIHIGPQVLSAQLVVDNSSVSGKHYPRRM